jgi:hypothetical protein
MRSLPSPAEACMVRKFPACRCWSACGAVLLAALLPSC